MAEFVRNVLQVLRSREAWGLLFSDVRFVLGLLLDLLVLPLAGVAYLLKKLCPGPLDDWFDHPLDLPPLLLVHGSGTSECQWLAARLWWYRRYAIYSVQLNAIPAPSTDSIRTYATVLSAKVEEVWKQHGQRPMTLVGASMGGLVCAYYAETDPLARQRIAHVVTVGTPFDGAPALRWLDFGTTRHKEMTPDSAFLRELAARMRTTPHYYTCFGSRYDVQVPYTNAWPDNTTCTIYQVEHHLGHMSGLVFPFVAWDIDRRLYEHHAARKVLARNSGS